MKKYYFIKNRFQFAMAKTISSRALRFLWPLFKRTSLVKGEYDLLNWLDLHEGNVVVEAGSRAGGLTKALSSRVGLTGKVIAIEPNPFSFKILCRMTEGLQNVSKVNAAMAAEIGVANLVIDRPFDSGGHVGVTNSDHSRKISVKTLTIDVLVENFDLRAIDYIIIDCEGFELQVLKGAEQSLRKGLIQNLIIELHSEQLVKLTSEYISLFGFQSKIVEIQSGLYPIMLAVKRRD